MNNTKKLIALFIIALAMVLGATVKAEVQKATLINGDGQKVVVDVGSDTAIFYLENGFNLMTSNLGAVSSPVITSQFFSVGGVEFAAVKQTMRKATSTLCSIKNPFGGATSTLQSLDYQITTGTSTAATIVASVSTLAYATSTTSNIVAAQSVASGAQDSMSDTFGASVSQADISPNNYVLMKVETYAAGGWTYTGKCQAVFRAMPR